MRGIVSAIKNCPYRGRGIVSCEVVELLANPKAYDLFIFNEGGVHQFVIRRDQCAAYEKIMADSMLTGTGIGKTSEEGVRHVPFGGKIDG